MSGSTVTIPKYGLERPARAYQGPWYLRDGGLCVIYTVVVFGVGMAAGAVLVWLIS